LTLIVGGGVITVAWLVYRPVLSIFLIAGLAVLIGGVYMLMHKKVVQTSTPSVPPIV
jgi:hypothetical protein